MKQIKNKKAQEELVGFAMIIIIVAVIVLVLFGISINKNKTQGAESYEIESFIQAVLQHTTECSTDYGSSYDDVGDLIIECYSDQLCYDEKSACDALNSTLQNILKESWKTGQDRPVKGYELNITSGNRIMLGIKEGNITSNYKGSMQSLVRRSTAFSIELRAYY